MIINISEYFEHTIARIPEKSAIIEGDKNISFNELYLKSLIVAQNIVSSDNSLNKPIAVYLSKSIESIYSNIGITYSGNIYMNLDVKTPVERLKNILNLIQPGILVTNDFYLTTISQICPVSTIIINIDKINFGDCLRKDSIFSRLTQLVDTDPYCIINTSGSTGTPKGVVLNHRSFIDFTEWANDKFQFCGKEIIGSLSPLVFDIYSFELCMLMSLGSTIVILPDNLAAFPALMLNLMQKTKVSFLFWVPTIMVNIANMNLLSKIELSDLKTIWFAGEVFPTKQFNYWKKNLPEVKFVNLYGPIEITLDCTFYIVERPLDDNEPIPIGFPCRNTDILILNEKNSLVKTNEEGELCVRGSSLAMGYYNNSERTSQVFVQNPLNNSYQEIIYRTGDLVCKNERGEIIFKGRKDSMIKHFGYRIELGEIEHVIINSLNLVKNGCVVYNFAKKEITLFYESKEDILIVDMINALGKIFPKYMIPSVFHKMDILPRNTNGKIDRLLLSKKINEL